MLFIKQVDQTLKGGEQRQGDLAGCQAMTELLRTMMGEIAVNQQLSEVAPGMWI